MTTPTPPARPRRGTSKHPTDMTGRLDEKQKRELADKRQLEEAGVTMANRDLRDFEDTKVIDFTDDGRPKVEPKPVIPEEPKEPKKYRIRVVADIENMTFGKEVIQYGDFTDPDNPVMPLIGSLKSYSFQEGRQYLVDENLYIHLRDLGYIYGE